MTGKCKKEERTRSVVLMLLFFLVSSTVVYPRNVAASTESGSTLVLFTTQEVFAPQQLVTLYANVSYNGAPVVGKLVAFQVDGPANAFENITVYGSGDTTNEGLAMFSFRLPWPSEHPEEIVFGNWSAVATVDIAQVTVKGTWTFRVGWILQITSITTLNSALVPQTTFFRQDVIYFNLTVENNATVEEPAAITIETEDAADHPIINITMQGLTPQPGESYVIAGPSQIPDMATTGNATVWAAIYTALPEEGGVLYSPAISTWFEIAEKPPIHDIGVTSVVVSPSSIYVGESALIVVTVKDNGTAIEQNCILSVYYNSSLIWIPIETIQVTLTPESQENATFSWNTSSVEAGLYRIKAYAVLPANEVDPSPGDNTLIDGFIQVMKPIPPVTHDIGLTSITLSAHSVYIGGVVNIYVTVKNNGTMTESNCTLSTYYNSSLIETIQVTLTPESQENATFSWNTSSVKAGVYQISASGTLPDDEIDPSPADNTLIDGFVQVMKPAPPVIHDIGLTSITLSTHSVYIGGVVNIYVTVKNNGTMTESFALSTYYNSFLVKTIQVNALAPGHQENATFSWNTSSVQAGVYQISASAPLAADPSPGDNTLIDGFVQVMPPIPPSLLLLGMFIAPTLGLAIIASLILLLMLGFLRRRKKKKPSGYAVIVRLHI